jgi:uncharacterized protein (DUF58 family)
VSSDGELIIYPAVDVVRPPPAQPSRTNGSDGSVGRGQGEDFLGLKLMRHGEDPRDIHWRKTASVGQTVMRERAREARPEVRLPLDVVKPREDKEDWDLGFERRVRDVASRAVAHLKRGDTVIILTNAGGSVRADRTAGADPLLRDLALVQSVAASDLSLARSRARSVPPPANGASPKDAVPA